MLSLCATRRGYFPSSISSRGFCFRTGGVAVFPLTPNPRLPAFRLAWDTPTFSAHFSLSPSWIFGTLRWAFPRVFAGRFVHAGVSQRSGSSAYSKCPTLRWICPPGCSVLPSEGGVLLEGPEGSPRIETLACDGRGGGCCSEQRPPEGALLSLSEHGLEGNVASLPPDAAVQTLQHVAVFLRLELPPSGRAGASKRKAYL